MWDQLPELILTQIFSHLGHGDRANVAQVCQPWNRALSSPVLWRSVTVFIDRDLRGDFPLAGELAAKYGQHMRSLELAWSRPYLLPREARITRNIQAEAGADFLTIVRAKNVQLKKLILTDWIFICKWGNRGKLLSALANFLGCQHNLEMLSLLNATLGVSDVLRLLGSASKGSTEHLAYLDLRGAFREWQAPHSNPRHVRWPYRSANRELSFYFKGISRYLRLLSRFHALTTLRLDYPALSDQTLIALTNAAPRVLKTLHISVRDSDSRHHTITDTAWHNLVLVCPELTVSYTIVNISHYEDMCYFLLPSVPLARFQMFSGHVWDQSRSRNFRSTVGLLITHYTNTLAEVMLQLRNNREMLDDLLVSMLMRCKQLTRLHCQHNLEMLSLLNATLGVSDVLRLLGSASKGSTEHLAYLDLRGAFREWQAPHSNPRHVRWPYRSANRELSFYFKGISRYLRLLSRFHALTTLRLDYPALSDQTLIALTNAAPRVLKTLHISVRDSDSRHHTITDTAWHNLVLVCPELTVSYTIGIWNEARVLERFHKMDDYFCVTRDRSADSMRRVAECTGCPVLAKLEQDT
ncbi:F-box only protein 39 [Eufriesea mexicana]|nr:F-box only protein 39 [Eufriesea mexicana]